MLENDAEGIELFRSEFLYLGRNNFPTEEEQFQAYKRVAQMMAGKKIIIRSLDIGADKQVDYFNLGQEDNLAMGYQAIRICLKQTKYLRHSSGLCCVRRQSWSATNWRSWLTF